MPPQRPAAVQGAQAPTAHGRKKWGGASRLLGPYGLGEGSAGPIVFGKKQKAGARLPPKTLFAYGSSRFAELGVATSSTGESCPMDRGRGVFGGGGGWVCPGARFKAWRGGQWGWLPSRLLRPRTVVLTLTPVEEKATRALPQGCRHSLCQLRDEIGSEISAGSDGPSAREVLEELEQARVGTDAQCSLFQIPSPAWLCHCLGI